MVSIAYLQAEHHHSGFAIGNDAPRLSWRYSGDEKDWTQASYEIKIVRAGKEETFTGATNQATYIPWPSNPLQSRESVVVSVRAKGSDGSETSWVTITIEAALFKRDDWAAQMITGPPQPDDVTKRPFRLSKTFKVAKIGHPARLYSTAEGIYEVEINGKRVGDHVLSPGWQSYAHHLVYQTYDVTDLLKPGENTIAAYVGPGWFAGRLGGRGGVRCIWGNRMGFFGQVEVDGKPVCASDKTWEWSSGPIQESEIFDGEVYDSRSDYLKVSGKVDVLSGPEGKLISTDSPPVRKVQEIKAKEIITTPSGKTILDFGENFVGWLRCERDIEGTGEMLLRHAEVLEDGELGVRPLRMAKARDIIKLGGPTKGWEPRFTFHGFRYAEVNGVPDLKLSDFVGIFISSDMRRTGTFNCSHKQLNTLHDNVIRSLRGNFVSIPTDCPQRDERQGWTGDIQVFTPTANFLFDTSSILGRWLEDEFAEQKEHHGIIPQITPWIMRKSEPLPRAIWGDVAVITPWELYQTFGDVKVLEDQWESMVLWLKKGVRRGKDDLWDPLTVQYGDWLDPRAPPQFPAHGRTDNHLACNAYLVYVTGLVARIGKLLGKGALAEEFQQDYNRLAQLYQKNYVTEGGRIVSDTQTAFALTLHFGLVDDGQPTPRRAKLIERLDYLIHYDFFKISTGFAGTPAILETLAENGLVQLAYRMLQEKDCPSWLYPVGMGATTIWERWDSMLPDGRINPGQMTSFNHFSLGAVANFMHGVVGGLSSLEPGWSCALIRPQPGGTIRSASVTHDSVRGKYAVDWRLQGTTLEVKATIPPNGRARVVLPGLTKVFGSGEYVLNVPWVDDASWPPKGIPGPQSTKIPDEYIP